MLGRVPDLGADVLVNRLQLGGGRRRVEGAARGLGDRLQRRFVGGNRDSLALDVDRAVVGSERDRRYRHLGICGGRSCGLGRTPGVGGSVTHQQESRGWWLATLTESRSIVGGTSRLAVPLNLTKPRLIRGGRRSANCFAACCAACNRVGSTSSARIDSETSIAIMTVARSRGTWTAAVGWAAPNARTASPAIRSANVRCRRHPGRFGATEASSETLLNRATYFFLRNWRMK